MSTPSPEVSNEAFEALIDLLASDDVPSERAPANVTLRDPSGRLDFDRIRTMYQTQHDSRSARENPPASVAVVSPHVDDDSDDDPSHRSASSSGVPSRTHSPKPVNRPSAGHRRSSTFGNQPGSAIHETAVNVEDLATPTLTLSRQPLSLDELDAALASAHEEVRSLRRQYDQLRALVAGRLGTEVARERAKSYPGPGDSNATPGKGRGVAPGAGLRPEPGASILSLPYGPPSDVPPEIAGLSESEAKGALSALVRSLCISPGALAGLSTLPPSQSALPPMPGREHDVPSIARALKFLGTVDELVWRRTSSSSGPRTLLPAFSEENVVALVARLELWERAVRRPARA